MLAVGWLAEDLDIRNTLVVRSHRSSVPSTLLVSALGAGEGGRLADGRGYPLWVR